MDKDDEFDDDTLALIKSGYCGTLGSGMLVDRRKFPQAYPMPANQLMGIPAPKPIKSNDNGEQ
jgi:hypothetical protein